MKEFEEFEEFKEFKNGNASKNAVITGIADKVVNGNPSTEHSNTPSLHFSISSPAFAALSRASRTQSNPIHSQPIQK